MNSTSLLEADEQHWWLQYVATVRPANPTVRMWREFFGDRIISWNFVRIDIRIQHHRIYIFGELWEKNVLMNNTQALESKHRSQQCI